MARSDKAHLQEKYEQFKQKIKILRKDNAKCNDDFSNFINVRMRIFFQIEMVKCSQT